jgi:hypothetical protein
VSVPITSSQSPPPAGPADSRVAASAPPSGPDLRGYALAAVAARLVGADLATEAPELRYLLERLRLVEAGGLGWQDALQAYLRQPLAVDRALSTLAGELGLTTIELLAVVLAATVEEDLMAGRALAYLQAPVGGSRPTLGLLTTVLADLAGPAGPPLDLLVNGPAVRSGLLTLLNEGAPLPERPVSVPIPLVLALRGQDAPWPGTTIGSVEAEPIRLPASVRAQAGRQALGLASGAGRTLVLRSGSPSEGRAVAAAVAAALGLRPLFVAAEPPVGLGPWLRLRGLLPVFQCELGPGERRVLAAVAGYDGPLLVLSGPDGSVESSAGPALTWRLSVPPRDERQALWETALGQPELADELARHHRHGSGRIAQLARLAQHQAGLEGRARPTAADLAAAAWSGEGAGLDALAQPLPDLIPDEALVTTPGLRQDLETLLLRCRARDSLVEGLGASAAARYRPGVRALFVGPSGTGKTLAVGWLATQLRLPLYRVDLAAVTSKYIGETEKNLANLLARAEQAEVVLLFDEADSLFGKRTEIREANDRFANAQTNYLLQRIESFDGIVVLTSNSRARFDTAFARRLDLIVEFALPGPDERRALWQSHLGPRHELTPRELNQLAATVDLGGGHIRNVVLTAAVLAGQADRPIGLADLVRGLEAEYRKLGRQVPVELRASG